MDNTTGKSSELTDRQVVDDLLTRLPAREESPFDEEVLEEMVEYVRTARHLTRIHKSLEEILPDAIEHLENNRVAMASFAVRAALRALKGEG